MTIEKIPESSLQYYLIAYDEKGVERSDDPDGTDGHLSVKAMDYLATGEFTDVFIISHGWKGDIPSAKTQYSKWIGVMDSCSADIEHIRGKRPDFNPLMIGFHWPSLPWGDEELGVDGVSFALGSGLGNINDLIDEYAKRIADTATARKALTTIFEAAREDIAPASLSQDVIEAYTVLDQEMGLGADGTGAAPGDDREPFDPEMAYTNTQEAAAVSFGGSVLGGLLSPLRQLSFWKMKDRARIVGEKGGSQLLANLQQAVPEGKSIRFHLIGHSFGCIVVSAMLNKSQLSFPVHSVTLLQGALSLWSYCEDIPVARGKNGYFHPIITRDIIAGPIISTQSEHDTAVGTWYPLAAGIKRQVTFAPGELPKYGAIGAFGARGPGVDVVDQPMLDVDGQYTFEHHKFYNLNASEYICEGKGFSGAHSDIAKPQVAHAIWSAVAFT